MTQETTPTPERKSPLEIAVYAILGAALLAIIVLVVIKWSDIVYIISSKEHIKAWLDGFGIWAPVAFILFQFLQVVVFIIPGEVAQIAGGYFFGIGGGILYSLIGIGLGSSFAFIVARKLGLAFVTKLFGKTQVGKFEGFISSPKAQVAFFLLFLIPGIPKDILCYVAGISYLSYGTFLMISLTGRLPALIGSIIIGNAAANQDWTVAIIIIIVATLLFGAGLIFRKQIHGWIESGLHRNPAHEKTADSAESRVAAPSSDADGSPKP